jgi:hypothetical protein
MIFHNCLGWAASLLIFFYGVSRAGEPAELEKDDPIVIKRTESPHKDLFVREESIDNRVLRLSVVSKALKAEIFKFDDSDPEMTVWKWEWADLSGSGEKRELLVWYSVFFGKGSSSHLAVYHLLPGERAMVKAVSIMYHRRASHVYPDQPVLSGELSFSKGIIDWVAKPENKATLDTVQWVWDAESRTFNGRKTPNK